MPKGKVIHPVEHDGERYEAGATIEAEKEVIDQLIAAGAVKDPSVKEEDESGAVDDAKAKAKEIVANAEKTLADAKDAAEKTAAQAKKDADKVIADAKDAAEKIVKDAQDAAAKAADSKTPTQTK